MRESERARALQGNPGLLSGLTPTQIAQLFPDYFRRGTPDVGGFQAAISKESARKQQLWQGSVDSRLDRQGGMLSRMRQEYGGGGSYGSTPASGNLKQNQQEAYKAARAEGLSDKAARALVANMSGEGLARPGAVNPDYNSRGQYVHDARGIVQWDPTRSEAIRAHFGKYPNEMSVAEQTKAAIWEMKSSNDPRLKQTWSVLNDPNASPDQMVDVLVRKYERSANQDADIVKRMSFYNGLKIDEAAAAGTAKQDDQKKGQTPQQSGGATTPGAPAGDTTAQAGKFVEGTKFNVVSGYVVPQDKSLYDSRNASQCATLGKAFNPNIGRSSGWTIVDGDIKAGQVVATKQYNNPGADRVGAGYHTGVALTAPNEKGDFLLLEQYNGSGGAKTRWVNKNSYPIGHTGQTTSWGLISSGGKVHDEISQEALAYGEKLGGPNKGSVGTNSGTPGQGGESAPGVEGEVTYAGAPGEGGGVSVGEGDSQSASLMRPVAMMQNLMGMMSGMGGTASPLGLITSAMGFIVPLIGTIAGERLTGEGMGGPAHGRRRRRHGHTSRSSSQSRTSPKQTTQQVAPANKAIEVGDPSRAQKFLSLISKGEGSYNSMNQGTVRGKIVGSTHDSSKVVGKKLTDMTIGEIMQMQQGSLKSGRKLFAVGKYQIIPNTMREMISRTGISKDAKFDEATQEKLGMALLQSKPNLNAYLTGKSNDIKSAMSEAAQVWASLPDPNTGKSKYGQGNKSSHSVESVRQALIDTRIDMLSSGSKFATDTNVNRQIADATPVTSTGQVGSGVTTPTAGMVPTTGMATQEKGFMEKIGQFAFGSKPSMAATSGSPVTPSNAPSISPSVTNVTAPAMPVPKESRTPFGIYSNPSRSDMMTQFGYKKRLDTASIVPEQSTTPAVTTPTRTFVASMPQSQPAPGPAPDTTAMQMRTQMQTIASTASMESPKPLPQMQQVSQVTQVLNHDHTMKMIQNPADSPSMYRAFARTAMGEELPGQLGHGHFSNGNSS